MGDVTGGVMTDAPSGSVRRPGMTRHQADQRRHGLDAQLVHDAAAMHLDRLFARPELEGNLLVEQTKGDARAYFALAFSESRQPVVAVALSGAGAANPRRASARETRRRSAAPHRQA